MRSRKGTAVGQDLNFGRGGVLEFLDLKGDEGAACEIDLIVLYKSMTSTTITVQLLGDRPEYWVLQESESTIAKRASRYNSRLVALWDLLSDNFLNSRRHKSHIRPSQIKPAQILLGR